MVMVVEVVAGRYLLHVHVVEPLRVERRVGALRPKLLREKSLLLVGGELEEEVADAEHLGDLDLGEQAVFVGVEALPHLQ